MRKFDTMIAGYTNEKDYNTFIYGRKDRYIPYDIDLYYDIKLPLIKKYMEEYISRDDGDWDQRRYGNYLIDIALNHFPLLYSFLSHKRNNAITVNVSEQLRKNFQEFLNERKERHKMSLKRQNKSGGEDLDETLESWVENARKGALPEILLMFKLLDSINHSFYLDGMPMPTNMTTIVEQYIKKMYKYLGLNAKLTFTFDTSYKTKKQKTDHLCIEDNTVVFRNIYFEDVSKFNYILRTVSQNKGLPNTSGNLIFDNCCFEGHDYSCELHQERDIFFHNCHFKGDFRLNLRSERLVVIDNCVVSECLNFTTNKLWPIVLNDSIFENDSTFRFEGSAQNTPMALHINDCVFHGGFNIEKGQIVLKMENVTFFAPLAIKDIRFDKHSHISNLCFPSVSSTEMETSKKQLYDALVNSELKELADTLNLISDTKPKKPTFDYKAYQAAYDSGWLKPEYAAYFLGKSINYLAKKRMADKKKATQQSLPFKGESKDIQYPVDALMAFKAKNWDKLKELRKKYDYTGRVNPSLGE